MDKKLFICINDYKSHIKDGIFLILERYRIYGDYDRG